MTSFGIEGMKKKGGSLHELARVFQTKTKRRFGFGKDYRKKLGALMGKWWEILRRKERKIFGFQGGGVGLDGGSQVESRGWRDVKCGENEPIVDEVLMQDFISWFGSIVHFLGRCMSGSCLEQVSGCKK